MSRLVVVLLLACATVVAAREGSPIPTRFQQAIDVPPRRQWNENSGYCGETSFISAGMYFGQYCSQFTARSIASPGVPSRTRRASSSAGSPCRAGREAPGRSARKVSPQPQPYRP